MLDWLFEGIAEVFGEVFVELLFRPFTGSRRARKSKGNGDNKKMK